jgi:5-keto 4-deoxyuronate isomerase
VFEKTYYATHPDMMACASNEELRDRYRVGGLFRTGEIVLTYSHGERFIIGGRCPRAVRSICRARPSRRAPQGILCSSGANSESSISVAPAWCASMAS